MIFAKLIENPLAARAKLSAMLVSIWKSKVLAEAEGKRQGMKGLKEKRQGMKGVKGKGQEMKEPRDVRSRPTSSTNM